MKKINDLRLIYNVTQSIRFNVKKFVTQVQITSEYMKNCFLHESMKLYYRLKPQSYSQCCKKFLTLAYLCAFI